MVFIISCLARANSTNMDPLLDPFMYRYIVGTLQYVTLTRHDIDFSVNKACQYMGSTLKSHRAVVKCIMRNRSGTLDQGFLMSLASPSCKLSLRSYNDSDWVSDPDGRRSITPQLILLF